MQLTPVSVLFLGLALAAAASPAPALDARDDIVSELPSLFLLPLVIPQITYQVSFAQTRCEQSSDPETPHGICQAYYSGSGEKIYGKRQTCRKESACNVAGNGCIFNTFQVDGGWYANCS